MLSLRSLLVIPVTENCTSGSSGMILGSVWFLKIMPFGGTFNKDCNLLDRSFVQVSYLDKEIYIEYPAFHQQERTLQTKHNHRGRIKC